MSAAERLYHLHRHLSAGQIADGIDTIITAQATTARELEQLPAAAAARFPSPFQRAHFEKHGYCIADDAVSPTMLAELRAAARRVRDRVHSGNLRHGFIHRSDTREPWGIRGVLSPQYGEPSFADYIGCPELVRYVQGFTRSQRLGLGAITIFTNPRDRPFTIGWHRDSGSPGGTKTYGDDDYTEVRERAEWEREQWANRSPGAPKTPESRGGVGFQLALLDSDAFELVPRRCALDMKPNSIETPVCWSAERFAALTSLANSKESSLYSAPCT